MEVAMQRVGDLLGVPRKPGKAFTPRGKFVIRRPSKREVERGNAFLAPRPVKP